MGSLLLLHSAYGLRPAVHSFAEQLRARGHSVTVPDYYDGHVFAGADGIAYRDRIGPRTLLRRVSEGLADLPEDTVLAGFSLGAAFAQHLAVRRPQAGGVVLLHNVSPARSPWPGQPVQVHRYARDPWIAEADVRELELSVAASGASFLDRVTPGEGHLFTDDQELEFDAAATALAIEDVDALLRRAPT
ncbi:dienelactone hydrolase family protein [Dermacoccaceae bacterium W4C1]